MGKIITVLTPHGVEHRLDEKAAARISKTDSSPFDWSQYTPQAHLAKRIELEDYDPADPDSD